MSLPWVPEQLRFLDKKRAADRDAAIADAKASKEERRSYKPDGPRDEGGALATPFEPKTQWRFEVLLPEVDGMDLGEYSYLCKSIKLPEINYEAITLNHINKKIKLKGKGEWADIEMTLYDQIDSPSTSHLIYHWIDELNGDYFNPESRRHPFSTDGSGYKRDFKIKITDPKDEIVGEWEIKGAIITKASFGDMDYASDELKLINLTIAYDFAEYTPKYPRLPALGDNNGRGATEYRKYNDKQPDINDFPTSPADMRAMRLNERAKALAVGALLQATRRG